MDTLSAWNSTTRQKITDKLQKALRDNLGYSNYRAGEVARNINGSEAGGMSLADLSPLALLYGAQEGGLQAGRGLARAEGGDVMSGMLDIAAGTLAAAPLVGVSKGGAKVAGVVKQAGKAAGKTLKRGKASMQPLIDAGEADIARSFLADPRKRIPVEDLDTAMLNRANLRAEKKVLPKKAAEMSPEELQAWGAAHGVNMSLTAPKGIGISDVARQREIAIPGGMEGTFTIPDMFWMKGNNFDPNALPQDVHNSLMQKFMRTYDRGPEGMDPVDRFNALNFALLSPNAPLTQNEFLAMRLRARDQGDLQNIGSMSTTDLRAAEAGTGAAARGGMGVKGTADLGNQGLLARLVTQNPDMFTPGADETLKDVGRRVMNQVPGLGPKTASLGVPWLDLNNANTSAVDLHMIRNAFPRLMQDPQLGRQFTERMATLTGQPAGTGAQQLLELAGRDAKFGSSLEDAAIKVIGGDSVGAKYRLADGSLNPRLHPAIAPEKLAYEPTQAIDFNPFYSRVVDYVDESRGPNPTLPLFPEQWRLWDRYRGRVEPHEMAHPDIRRLPKMSWEEMQSALQAHKDAGYTGTKGVTDTDWRKLLYFGVGGATVAPGLLGLGSQED